MKHMTRRIAGLAVAAALSLTPVAWGATLVEAQAVGVQRLPDINTWFAHLAPDELAQFVGDFQEWEDAVAAGESVTFGEAAPLLGYHLPSYDLKTATVEGAPQLSSALVATGEYCARALVDTVPANFVVCAEPTADSSDYQLFEASEVRFATSTVGADLPQSGITSPPHHFVGVVNGSVVAIDQTARDFLGAPQMDGRMFVTMLAKRAAEWAAVVAVEGHTTGGEIPLIGGVPQEVTAFEQAVSKGSGVPLSSLTHPWTLTQAEHGQGAISGGGPYWVGPALFVGGVLLVVAIAVRRRAKQNK